MARNVSAQLYDKYKSKVLEMSPAIQYYEGTVVNRESSSLSDREIADRLGLETDEVTEIRCMAEIDLLPADAWVKAAEWKRERCQKSKGK